MSKWNIDPDHSVAAFSIDHMTVARVHGQMNGLSGMIAYDPDDLSTLSVDLRIGLDSIMTGIQKRDDHLKSADFFGMEDHPEIGFSSTSAVPSRDGKATLTGNLNMHGIEKEIAMEVSVSGPAKSPFGDTTIGITGSIVLNREDFGITWNQPLEGGGFMVGREVNISVSLEGDLEE